MTDTHEARLLDYLTTNGKISPLEAWTNLGIYRLSAVIFKLREDGHTIKTHRKVVFDGYEKPRRFAEYTLKKEA
jgi:hypothetical protein